jgi:hypothetical protein
MAPSSSLPRYNREGPPKLEVQGEGLQAVVTVGEQRVRFNGEALAFEPQR